MKRSRLMRGAAGVLAALSIAAGAAVALPGPVGAVTGYKVWWTGGIGVRLRNSPNFNDVYGPGPAEGEPIDIMCQVWGDATSTNNHIWDKINWRGVQKFIPDAYTNTPRRVPKTIPKWARPRVATRVHR